ncbi:MAG: hypothetical protein PHG54_11580 [Smithellaceae bacterium]|nr:hypothetical protein [Smithellaceae bacterium]NLX50871.1 hypothetical protein [Deltaproteobacteria bacterium]
MVKQILFAPVINKRKAFGLHRFVFFSWFVQNHRQARPDSPKTLPDQPHGFGVERFKHLDKFSFRFFRNRYFNHFLFLPSFFRISRAPQFFRIISRRRNKALPPSAAGGLLRSEVRNDLKKIAHRAEGINARRAGATIHDHQPACKYMSAFSKINSAAPAQRITRRAGFLPARLRT